MTPKKLRSAIEALYGSQARAARHTGYSREHLNRVLNGKRPLPSQIKLALSEGKFFKK